jgi:rhamnosyl/mannosyltransferase
VADGRTGFLSEAGDAEGFAAKVLTLAGDSGLAARFGAAGRERVEQHFDLPRMVEDIEELYLRLCRG